jgi:hypothetical protein
MGGGKTPIPERPVLNEKRFAGGARAGLYGGEGKTPCCFIEVSVLPSWLLALR